MCIKNLSHLPQLTKPVTYSYKSNRSNRLSTFSTETFGLICKNTIAVPIATMLSLRMVYQCSTTSNWQRFTSQMGFLINFVGIGEQVTMDSSGGIFRNCNCTLRENQVPFKHILQVALLFLMRIVPVSPWSSLIHQKIWSLQDQSTTFEVQHPATENPAPSHWRNPNVRVQPMYWMNDVGKKLTPSLPLPSRSVLWNHKPTWSKVLAPSSLTIFAMQSAIPLYCPLTPCMKPGKIKQQSFAVAENWRHLGSMIYNKKRHLRLI